MKYFVTIIWAIICIEVLLFGHHYWNTRTTVKADIKTAAVPSAPAKVPDDAGILAKTNNWPPAARGQFQQDLQQNKPFKILFVGSKALGSKDQGMLKDVVSQLTAAYGSHIDISIDTYDTTTGQFLADKDQLQIEAEKAQLIVFEPFILNDNGNEEIGNSLTDLTTIIQDVKAADPETTFILQPSYPLYQAVHYPVQVAQLKQYAQQQQIPYLDHWTAWPDTNNPALTNDLLPDQSAANDNGNQIWSQYLINYFISK